MFKFFRNKPEMDPISEIREQVADTVVNVAKNEPVLAPYDIFRDYEGLVNKKQYPRLRRCARSTIRSAGVKEALEKCKELTEDMAQKEAEMLRGEIASKLGIDELSEPQNSTERESLTEGRWNDEPFLELHATDEEYIADIGAKAVVHGLRLALQDCTIAARESVEELAA